MEHISTLHIINSYTFSFPGCSFDFMFYFPLSRNSLEKTSQVLVTGKCMKPELEPNLWFEKGKFLLSSNEAHLEEGWKIEAANHPCVQPSFA